MPKCFGRESLLFFVAAPPREVAAKEEEEIEEDEKEHKKGDLQTKTQNKPIKRPQIFKTSISDRQTKTNSFTRHADDIFIKSSTAEDARRQNRIYIYIYIYMYRIQYICIHIYNNSAA